MQDDKTRLIAWIKARRQAKGWSQRELARRLQITYTAVQAWESGASEPRTEHIKALAHIFGLQAWELWREVETGEIANSKNLQDLVENLRGLTTEELTKLISAAATQIAKVA
jgi:transcriptional regulator with XRE-family HTH domain